MKKRKRRLSESRQRKGQNQKRHQITRRSRRPQVNIHCSPQPHVSVIIPVMNEEKSIIAVLAQAAQIHPSMEIIIVINGSSDATERIVRNTGARIIRYADPLGHDVGRAIGAMEAKGDILLFLDGDIPIPAAKLKPFVRAIENGVDVALNQYLGPTHKEQVHAVILAKHALNISLSRADLKGVSLTTIPNAISRKALSCIGAQALAVPPYAYVKAIMAGLKVEAIEWIDVGKRNPSKRKKADGRDPLASLILGDHLEAINQLLCTTDQRGNMTDLYRKREWANAESKEKKKSSANINNS